MKRIFAVVLAVLMILSACSKPETTENESATESQSTSENEAYENSETIKKIREFEAFDETAKNYPPLIKCLDNGLWVFDCGDGLCYIQLEDGSFISSHKLGVDEKIKIDNISASEGSTDIVLHYENDGVYQVDFPHRTIYSLSDGSILRENFPVNEEPCYYPLGYFSLAEADFGKAVVSNSQIEIYFDLEYEENGPDNPFPRIDYFYDYAEKTVTMYFYGCSYESSSVLEKFAELGGISSIQIEPFETELTNFSDKKFVSGTKLSFSVDTEYELYGEIRAEFGYSKDDNICMYTVKSEN